MDSFRDDTELVGVVTGNNCNSSQSIDVEVHQIVVDSGTRMITDDGKMDIPVDEGEETAHVDFQSLERFVDKWLRDIFAIGLRVLEVESIALRFFYVGMLRNERCLLLDTVVRS